MARNYAKEYENYQGTPEQIANRSARNKARAEMVKKGLVRKGDGKDVDHKDSNPRNNKPSNWQVKPASDNRSFPRTKTAREKR